MTWLAAGAIIMTLSCHTPRAAEPPMAKEEPLPIEYPQNIIFMVAHGLGLTQISAAMYDQGNRTALERCPVAGLHKPLAEDGSALESAQAANAFSSGRITYPGAIGLGPDSMPMPQLMRQAAALGWHIGLLSTGDLSEAPAAAYYAQTRKANDKAAIVDQLPNAGFTLAVGGGKLHIDPQNLQSRGYAVIDYKPGVIQRAATGANLVCFTPEGGLSGTGESQAALAQALGESVDLLRTRENDQGFLLLVDAAQIGKAAQANDSSWMMAELRSFDKAIDEALNFAAEDGRTLVVVAGDSEIGGYALKIGPGPDVLVPTFNTRQATTTLSPVFAYGPGAELFSGIYRNTDIYKKLCRAIGL